MKTDSTSELRNLVRYALLASIAIMLQISAVLFPGPGRVLAAFNTLPIALAAYMNPRGGIFCYLVATWLGLVIVPAEMPILALCTAPLGLAIGWGLHASLKKSTVVLTGTFTFAAGMGLMTLLLGIPVFGPLVANGGPARIIPFYTGFAFIYAWAWVSLVQKMIRHLVKMGIEFKL